MTSAPIRLPIELYDQIVKLAEKNRRTLQAQLEIVVEKGLKK